MISTHVLDTSAGNPAEKVKVTLEKFIDRVWVEIACGFTNDDGRHLFDVAYEEGKYRITFFTVDFFKRKNQPSFFLDSSVAFQITDTSRKYHVPLLLNPYGYSTYRGS